MKINIPTRLYKALFVVFIILLGLAGYLIYEYNEAKTQAVDQWMIENPQYHCEKMDLGFFETYTTCTKTNNKWQNTLNTTIVPQ